MFAAAESESSATAAQRPLIFHSFPREAHIKKIILIQRESNPNWAVLFRVYTHSRHHHRNENTKTSIALHECLHAKQQRPASINMCRKEPINPTQCLIIVLMNMKGDSFRLSRYAAVRARK